MPEDFFIISSKTLICVINFKLIPLAVPEKKDLDRQTDEQQSDRY